MSTHVAFARSASGALAWSLSTVTRLAPRERERRPAGVEHTISRPHRRTTPPRISVIVPATNGPATLDACVRALRECDSPPDEIVVVDGPVEANAARARNEGASRATGDVLLFVDADVEVLRDAVERVREAFEADEALAALFGSYDDAPAAPGVASGFRNLLHHHVHQSAPGRASTFWTGLGAVRRDIFFEVGGFDESIEFMEDVDLGMRIAETGGRIVLDPAVQGTHLKRWTVWSMLRTDVVARGIPWVRILLRHRHSSRALNLGWSHRLSAITALGTVLALALWQPFFVLGTLALLIALNFDFYVLLVRRRGPLQAAAGVVLHTLHHLASIVSVPIGVWLHLRDNRRARHALRSATLS